MTVAIGKNLDDPNEPALVNGEWKPGAGDINWHPIKEWVLGGGNDNERLVYVSVFSKKTGRVSDVYHMATSSDTHIWIGDMGNPFKRLGDIYVRDSPFLFERMTHFACLGKPEDEDV